MQIFGMSILVFLDPGLVRLFLGFSILALMLVSSAPLETSPWVRLLGTGCGARLHALLLFSSPLLILSAVVTGRSSLAPLVLSSKYASRENSLAFITIPSREATVFEKSSSYATYEIARRRGIPGVLIDRSLIGRFYGFTGDRILRHRSLESTIIEIIVNSVEKISGFLRASERIGSRIYVVSGIIGASLEVYGEPHNTFRVLEKRVSCALRDPEILYRSRSVFLIARAPKKLFEKTPEAFVKYIGGFPEILVHNSLYVEYSSRLELYYIILLYGYSGIKRLSI